MRDVIDVSVVSYTPAPGAQRMQGLVGWAELRVPGLHLDAIAIRRARDGRYVLSYPRRRNRSVVWPESDEARRAIEQRVIGELRRRGDVP